MSTRDLTHAERLVAELAELRRKESQYEKWRWQASMGGFYKRFMLTRTTVETSVLGFKSRSDDSRWDEMPEAVADEFHSFLAKKRNEAYRRAHEVERELQGLS